MQVEGVCFTLLLLSLHPNKPLSAMPNNVALTLLIYIITGLAGGVGTRLQRLISEGQSRPASFTDS
jgi:hypothetical protein